MSKENFFCVQNKKKKKNKMSFFAYQLSDVCPFTEQPQRQQEEDGCHCWQWKMAHDRSKDSGSTCQLATWKSPLQFTMDLIHLVHLNDIKKDPLLRIAHIYLSRQHLSGIQPMSIAESAALSSSTQEEWDEDGQASKEAMQKLDNQLESEINRTGKNLPEVYFDLANLPITLENSDKNLARDYAVSNANMSTEDKALFLKNL